jgi:hypothetical protein
MAKAIYHKGQRTTTKGQQKKYYTQMTQDEINYLYNEILKISRLRVQSHMWDKIDKYELDAFFVRNVLDRITKESIIEYNNGRGQERRVVLEDKRNTIEASDGSTMFLTVVIDIDKQCFVTLWVNDINDTHATLDMSYYNKNLKIIK